MTEQGMTGQEWSRSRYWLCHFLQSRHTRERIDFQPHHEPQCADPVALSGWLNETQLSQDALKHQAWLTNLAAQQHVDDPAFVQTLRLVMREKQHLADLANNLMTGLPEPSTGHITRKPTGIEIRKRLGLRFELSVQLLRDSAELPIWHCLANRETEATCRGVAGAVLRDKMAHVSLFAERLTQEFADFNFARRNLRRWRLRCMFAGVVVDICARHGEFLHSLELSKPDFAKQSWRGFNRVLESMMPYRRDALVQSLLEQREHPYRESRQPLT